MSRALFSVFIKDLVLFSRDRKNLVLVVLTPVLIMAVLGNLALQEPESQFLDNVPFGLCNRDPAFSLPYEFDLVSPPEDCEASVTGMVGSGELRGALFVPETFSADIREGRGSTLTLVLDNSKARVAFSIRTAMESMVNSLNERIGVAFISAAWVALADLNGKLKFVVEHLAVSRGVVSAIQERALALNSTLTGIEAVPGQDALARANATMGELASELEQASSLIELARNASALDAELANATAGMAERASGLEPLAGELANLTAAYGSACACANCSSQDNLTAEGCAALNASIVRLSETLERYEAARASLGNASLMLENASSAALAYYDALTARINATLPLLTERNLTPSQDDIALAESLLGEVRRVQDDVRSQLVELDTIVVNLTGQILTLEEELNRTTALLDAYTEKDPVNIVRAVSLESVETFPKGTLLAFLAPNMALMVLLFITLLVSSMALVDERRSMTMFRTLLSPLPLWLNLLQKLLFIVALCGLQIALMSAVVLALGARYSLAGGLWWQLLAALLAASALFASLGFLIGSLSKSENTALLSSLVLAIPMMFLSGLLFPLEGMSLAMSRVAFWSPLTLAVTSIERVLIYRTGLDPALLAVQAGIAIAAFLLASLFLSRNPSAD